MNQSGSMCVCVCVRACVIANERETAGTFVEVVDVRSYSRLLHAWLYCMTSTIDKAGRKVSQRDVTGVEVG